VCFAHGTVGRFLLHTWVNAQPVPRFYPNIVTLTTGGPDIDEQRQTVQLLLTSNLPGLIPVCGSCFTTSPWSACLASAA